MLMLLHESKAKIILHLISVKFNTVVFDQVRMGNSLEIRYLIQRLFDVSFIVRLKRYLKHYQLKSD